jgi:hypothetical protein
VDVLAGDDERLEFRRLRGRLLRRRRNREEQKESKSFQDQTSGW